MKMAPLFKTCKPLILASASPRRQKYLQNLGLEFRSEAADREEVAWPGEEPESFVRRMALEKATHVARTYPGMWVLAADTVVCLGARILGKPENPADALAMLMLLAGQEHQVRTGACLCCPAAGVTEILSVVTRVRFASFEEEVAAAYVATGEPLDKAGAYGIQGKGAFLVKDISGSYSNVVGLPLVEIVDLLQVHGVIRPGKGSFSEVKSE